MINLIKNRDDLKRWLLATSDYGNEIQENLNAVVGHDGKFTNSIVRHALDLKDDPIFRNPSPINMTFYDMKKKSENLLLKLRRVKLLSKN